MNPSPSDAHQQDEPPDKKPQIGRREIGAFLFGGLAVILAVPFTSAVATLMDVLVLGHEPPTEQPRRSLRLLRSR